MNDLELLEQFRADVAAPDPAVLGEARAGMFREPPVRKVAHRRWQLVPIAGLAAAVTIAVAVTAWPSSGPPAPPASAGAQLLRLAADEARQEPLLRARPDQFVFFETKVVFNGPNGQKFPPSHQNARTEQRWLSVDGSRTGAFHAASDGPRGIRLEVNGKLVPGPDVSPAYRRDLPTDVAAMRRYLYAPAGRGGTADGLAWGRVGDLLHNEYLPPDTTAALFEAAATIPGTTVLPNQVDLAGRPGIAVSRVSGEFRQDLLFDPSTHRLLGERETELRDTSTYTKGTVVSEDAQLRVAIVDRAGQLP